MAAVLSPADAANLKHLVKAMQISGGDGGAAVGAAAEKSRAAKSRYDMALATARTARTARTWYSNIQSFTQSPRSGSGGAGGQNSGSAPRRKGMRFTQLVKEAATKEKKAAGAEGKEESGGSRSWRSVRLLLSDMDRPQPPAAAAADDAAADPAAPPPRAASPLPPGLGPTGGKKGWAALRSRIAPLALEGRALSGSGSSAGSPAPLNGSGNGGGGGGLATLNSKALAMAAGNGNGNGVGDEAAAAPAPRPSVGGGGWGALLGQLGGSGMLKGRTFAALAKKSRFGGLLAALQGADAAHAHGPEVALDI
eukprot:tig00000042_g15621.t1